MKRKHIWTHVSLTVIGDLTGHQIELLQTPTLLSDDLHTPADTQQERSKVICTRSLIKAGVIPAPERNYITQSLNVTRSDPFFSTEPRSAPQKKINNLIELTLIKN